MSNAEKIEMPPKNLTPAMEAALAHAKRNGGYVVAGTDVWKGSVVRTAATVLRALERRGLVTLAVSPDGGMCARLTEAADDAR